MTDAPEVGTESSEEIRDEAAGKIAEAQAEIQDKASSVKESLLNREAEVASWASGAAHRVGDKAEDARVIAESKAQDLERMVRQMPNLASVIAAAVPLAIAGLVFLKGRRRMSMSLWPVLIAGAAYIVRKRRAANHSQP